MKLRQVEILRKAAGRTSRILRQAVLGSISQEKPAVQGLCLRGAVTAQRSLE